MKSRPTFGNYIYLSLQEKGIKQKEFAKLIDVSEISVSNYVNGKQMPHNAKLKKIAEVLEDDYEELKKQILKGFNDETEKASHINFDSIIKDLSENAKLKIYRTILEDMILNENKPDNFFKGIYEMLFSESSNDSPEQKCEIKVIE